MLYVIGIGPGNMSHLSKRAFEVIEQVEVIAGYTTYVELIKDLITEKEVISTSILSQKS
jgi:precorrin-3B C17-methyltransferase